MRLRTGLAAVFALASASGAAASTGVFGAAASFGPEAAVAVGVIAGVAAAATALLGRKPKAEPIRVKVEDRKRPRR